MMTESFILDRTEDILFAPIKKIGNKLYRINPSKSVASAAIPIGQLEQNDDLYDQPSESEFESDQNCHIYEIRSEAGGYVASFYVPPIFHPIIIGTRHSQQEELESEFSCRLNFPSQQSALSHIKISANSKSNIRGVARRIAWIVSETRPKMKPTHFVCLPVINEPIKLSYMKLRGEILQNALREQCGLYRGIDEDLFVSQHKLHLTIATLFLADQKEVRLASKLLSTFMDSTDEGKAFDRSPLSLTIRGFDCMNDDPKSVRVLYMMVQDNVQSRRFQVMANGIADMFTCQGLHSGVRRLGDPVKLHMTVLSSRLRSQRRAGVCEAPSASSEDAFCAVGPLRDFETRSLVENGRFEEIRLCKMIATEGGEDEDPNGFYPCIAKLTWPNTS